MHCTKNKKKPDTSILVAEDNPVDFAYVQALLNDGSRAEDKRFSLTHVKTIGEAVSELSYNDYDCVLLDYHMPDGDAFEALSLIRSRVPWQKEAPIILMTGGGNENIAVEAMKRGVADYVRKNDLSSERLSQMISSSIIRPREEPTPFNLMGQSTRRHVTQHPLHCDKTTKLPNALLFKEVFQTLIHLCKRNKKRFGVTFVQAEVYGRINEDHGLQEAEKFMLEMSDRLRLCVRESDALARISPDTFAVLLPELAERYDELLVSNRIRKMGFDESKPFYVNKQLYLDDFNISSTVYPDQCRDPNQLYDRAVRDFRSRFGRRSFSKQKNLN